jgi:hypothetical protein
MYVDESGDPGIAGSRTDRYILTGLVIHELRWRDALDELIEFRRSIRQDFKWKVRDELHAQVMVNGRISANAGVARNDRFMILRRSLDWLASRSDIGIITIVVEKSGFENAGQVFEIGWKCLVQRFENTLSHRNFPGPQNPEDRGLIIPDNTNGEELRLILRRMRRFNPIPSQFQSTPRNLPIRSVVEDPVLRDSRHSYFIQMADVCAYFAQQYFKPNKVVKKQGARNYYQRLEPVVIKKAASGNLLGMVIVKK